MARPRKLSPVDTLQARINEIKKLIDPAFIEGLKAELKKLEEAVKFIGENTFLMEAFSVSPAKGKGGRPKGKTKTAKKVVAKKASTGRRGRPKGSKNKKAE